MFKVGNLVVTISGPDCGLVKQLDETDFTTLNDLTNGQGYIQINNIIFNKNEIAIVKEDYFKNKKISIISVDPELLKIITPCIVQFKFEQDCCKSWFVVDSRNMDGRFHFLLNEIRLLDVSDLRINSNHERMPGESQKSIFEGLNLEEKNILFKQQKECNKINSEINDELKLEKLNEYFKQVSNRMSKKYYAKITNDLFDKGKCKILTKQIFNKKEKTMQLSEISNGNLKKGIIKVDKNLNNAEQKRTTEFYINYINLKDTLKREQKTLNKKVKDMKKKYKRFIKLGK